MISSRNVWLTVALALAMLVVACGGASDDGDEATSADAPAATATEAAAGIQRTYAAAPPMTIDVSHGFEAVLLTENGEIRIELLPADAPGYVNNFVFLARNDFYDGLTFHRVIAGFMAQGGDPEGQGFGGPGYNLIEEKNELEFGVGVLSMAKAAQVSGSQFFITLAATPFLEGDFTVFGQVIEGLDVLQQITVREPGPDALPASRIIDIEIVETP
ncbi:MAG TPA: peptidylprolyl isomerase [Dehalococcoidia bacterium]|nr:peptidylprolyl isomerase [Dehalococcoidia bacterium]